MAAVLALPALCLFLTSPARADRSAEEIASTTIERDIEGPEIFDAAGDGIWDGRPSTGGIWIAHPDAEHPTRVLIRNESNGLFVVGALFRRESSDGAPEFQLSADAANALGLAADVASPLRVTAVRREEVIGAPVEAEAPTGTPPEQDRPAPVSPLARPFIQIGLFSVERNAERAASRLASNGLPVEIRKSVLSGKTYWRVLVGPAQTSAARAQNLTKVKALGYSDSYAVKG